MSSILRNEYIICYDIADTKTRSLLHRELMKNGLRNVQKSVFWGYLTMAELNFIKRFMGDNAKKEDLILIARTDFNKKGFGYLIGDYKDRFIDWEENYVI